MLGAIEAGGTKFVLAVGPSPDRIAARHTIPTRDPATTLAEAAEYLVQELACFDRAYKSGQLPHPEVALGHLVTLFIKPVPKLFSLQQQLAT